MPEATKTKEIRYALWCKYVADGDAHGIAAPQHAGEKRVFEFATKQAALDQMATYRSCFPARIYGIQEVKTTVRTSTIVWEDDAHEPKNNCGEIFGGDYA